MYEIVQHKSAVVLGIPVGTAAVGVEIQLAVVGHAAILDLKEGRILLADHVEGLAFVGLNFCIRFHVADIVGQNQAVVDGRIVIVSRNGHKDVSV